MPKAFVYIVDADVGVREGMCRLLRAAGFDARACGAVDELQIQTDSRAACILLDISMPATQDQHLLASLCRVAPALPLIAISTRDDAAVRQRARELGACFFMCKPVDDQALIDALHWVIESGPEGVQARRDSVPMPTNSSGPPPRTH